MQMIKIDDVEYDLDALSDEAKAQIQAIHSTDKRIADVNEQLAILQTARNAYSAALSELLAGMD